MHPPGAETVLVRYGEIGIKSHQVQARLERRLRENLAAKLAFADVDSSVRIGQTRLYVDTAAATIDAATAACTDVFGVVSASPTVRTDPTMDAIRDTLSRTAVEHYDGGSFAIDARRAGPPEAHPFSSTDIEESGGTAVWETACAEGIEPRVDLDAPDITFYVECRPEDAYVFLERRPGPGGLPIGCQQPLVALISGGIDSPVAAWLAMKRGCPIYPLYIDLGEYGGVDHRLRTERTVARLQSFAPNHDLRLRIAPGGAGIDRIVSATDRCRMLLLRRFMFRIADRVGQSPDAVGIVTGESIGQKSSQTSANLRCTSAVTELPVHRPLCGMDKTTITDRAREIGTYEDATIDAGCNRVAPEQPATRPSIDVVRDLEPDDLAEMAVRAAEDVTTLERNTSVSE